MFKQSEITAMRRAVKEDQRRKLEAAQSEPVLDERQGHLAALASRVASDPDLLAELGPEDPLACDLARVARQLAIR